VFVATDPVCGMEVYENMAPAMAQYEGVTYYFCSKKCLGKFEDRPEAYIMEAA
jgi:Cu+-exporting ATPase